MKITSSASDTGFWQPWLSVNTEHAIYHQWEQLEASGCIDNFRILAGEKEGFREGWFFADSDAYKWLDAASRIYAIDPSPQLGLFMDDFIHLLQKSQADDGYIFTYNQLLFPDTRWINLQIEHELYCHGHLIEAGVSHYNATGSSILLDIARKAADRIVEDFHDKGPAYTPGHEEIEIALLRLFEVTGHQPYLVMAKHFLEMRGRQSPFAPSIIQQFISVGKRTHWVEQQKQSYQASHPGDIINRVPPGNFAKKPANAKLRWYLSALSGKYFQQHQPLSKQNVPVGHSVRFAYLQTAAAMLERITKQKTYMTALEKSWERMVQHRMYITGGIGSLPEMEGFGRDEELDPEFAYAETCAALGSIFWNWEMAQITGKAQYSDLLEWQLYNAALVGMGLNGQCYLYNNPLASHSGIQRRAWFAVPCCPSNLSRTWADLMKYALSADENTIWIHQYINSDHHIRPEEQRTDVGIRIESSLPWDGRVMIHISTAFNTSFTLKLRKPSWCCRYTLSINHKLEHEIKHPVPTTLDPQRAEWISLERSWRDGDLVELIIDLPIQILHANPKVKGHQGKVTVSRGPLVYCLESPDQPDINIFDIILDPATLRTEYQKDLLGGIMVIKGLSIHGQPLTFIPYHVWGNRGESQMTVWVHCKE